MFRVSNPDCKDVFFGLERPPGLIIVVLISCRIWVSYSDCTPCDKLSSGTSWNIMDSSVLIGSLECLLPICQVILYLERSCLNWRRWSYEIAESSAVSSTRTSSLDYKKSSWILVNCPSWIPIVGSLIADLPCTLLIRSIPNWIELWYSGCIPANDSRPVLVGS